MIDRLAGALKALLPLPIDSVKYNDPMVLLDGPGWSLSVACPWRLTRDGLLVCAYGDRNAETALQELIGASLIEMDVEACARPSTDPAFRLAGNRWLEVFADTDLDPWVMRLSAQTFIGSASAAGDAESR